MNPHNLNPQNPYFYASQRAAMQREQAHAQLVRQTERGPHRLAWVAPLWRALGRLLARAGQRVTVEQTPVEAPRAHKSLL